MDNMCIFYGLYLKMKLNPLFKVKYFLKILQEVTVQDTVFLVSLQRFLKSFMPHK